MTTTKSIAEQVAEVEVGEYVRADFLYPDAEVSATGELTCDGELDLYIGETFIADRLNEPAPYLVSITRVPRPIPSEPEVGSFALTTNGFIYQNNSGWQSVNCLGSRDWSGLYPHITRLYTPSGELVTGFEYAQKGGN